MIVFDAGMLRQCRRKLKMKQSEVAEAVCKAPGCISRQENGQMRVSAEDLAAYAQLYGVGVDVFYKEKIQMS